MHITVHPFITVSHVHETERHLSNTVNSFFHPRCFSVCVCAHVQVLQNVFQKRNGNHVTNHHILLSSAWFEWTIQCQYRWHWLNKISKNTSSNKMTSECFCQIKWHLNVLVLIKSLGCPYQNDAFGPTPLQIRRHPSVHKTQGVLSTTYK